MEIPIRWYRCPPGAKVFPGYSRFGLGYWAWDKSDTPGVGQVGNHNLAYDKGQTPATATGQNFCGTLSNYADGLGYPPSPPLVSYDMFGMATCCPGSGPPVPPPPPPPPPGEDALDFNFWKQVSNSDLTSWYAAGYSSGFGPAGQGLFGNGLTALPFLNTRGGTLDALGLYVYPGTSISGDRCRLGIYAALSDTDFRPDSLLFDSGEIDLHAADGFRTVPCNLSLDRTKLHWLVILADPITIGTQALSVDAARLFPVFGVNVGPSAQVWRSAITKIFPYGPLPSPFPTVTDADFSTVPAYASPLVRFSA